MKLHPEHYDYMKRIIDALPAVTIDNLKDNALNNGKAKDVHKFYRWHVFYMAGLSAYACDMLYSYADDTHIDTALKRIVKELKIGLQGGESV